MRTSGIKIASANIVWTLSFIILMVFIVPVTGAAAGKWPSGLEEAAKAHFQKLQKKESITRDSTVKDPLGIVPTAAFDRATHNCHETPGQAYRVYRKPIFIREADRGIYIVRAKYLIFSRQADSVDDLFVKPWQEGSDAVLEVHFKLIDGKWAAVGKQERLSIRD
jgi:hypothetical protein